MDKVVELVGGGSVINGAYPVYFFKRRSIVLLLLLLLLRLCHAQGTP